MHLRIGMKAPSAVLEDGTTVVVKRLKEVVAGKREFEQQMELIGKVCQHQNTVPLRAYYYSKDEKLLVYDYVPLGSLCAALHGNKAAGRTPLDWETRVKIALGTARGMAYLHSVCLNRGGVTNERPTIVHWRGNTRSLELCPDFLDRLANWLVFITENHFLS